MCHLPAGRTIRPLLGVLLTVLAVTCPVASAAPPLPAADLPGRLPLLDEAETWKRLPRVEVGEGTSLPNWARMLAPSLPRTTAAMLELDFLQRCRNPLEPKLRGKLRWVAAHANHCAYSEAHALADLRRAGLDEAEIEALTAGAEGSATEQAALVFARNLTLEADTVSDAEVARLLDLYGEKQVVAMVLLLAYANFQDRLLLALDVPLERGGPLPPREVRFARPVLGTLREGPRRMSPQAHATASAENVVDPPWRELDFQHLQKEMERQRQRRARIRLPADRPLAMNWATVCQEYQPELAASWSACTRAFSEEANPDRVFAARLFWVVTRSVRCFY